MTLDHVRAALALNAFDAGAAQLAMAPNPRGIRAIPRETPPRQAAVLALLYPENDALHVLLTRRPASLRDHSGQVSFPGGKRDPHDASFTATALREACEELGLCDLPIQVLGHLTPLYIPPSHFEVHPVVAALDALPQVRPNPIEVDEVFSLALADLLDARLKSHETQHFNGVDIHIPYYAVNGHKVWGATAIMLSELEYRLRAVLPGG